MKNTFVKLKKAFTLAEVLITLVIIGVIAAFTIPTVVSNYRKQEYVSRLKKTYSALSQVTGRIIVEEGNPKASVGGWCSSSANVFNLYKKYLNNAKECLNGENCWETVNISNLQSGASYNYSDSNSRIILGDGTFLMFRQTSSDCSLGGDNNDYGMYQFCALLWVDVNGAKGPNTWGRDNFQFVITEDGLKPRGCGLTPQYVSSKCTNGDGHACACKVLTENAMNY